MEKSRYAFSLEGKLLFIAIFSILFAVLILYLCLKFVEEPYVAYSFALLLSVLFATWWVRRLARNFRVRITALHNGLLNLIDNDFSVSLTNLDNDALADVIHSFNEVTEKLRSERQHLYQRELLLDTVIQNSSLILLLTDDKGCIVYANSHAHHLLNNGKPIQGLNLELLIQTTPLSFQKMIAQRKDGLIKLGSQGQENTFHLSNGRFVLNTKRHDLFLIKDMTREFHRQEAAAWKRAIRVISHELNNTLAPISSMAHSGKLMIEKNKPEGLPQLFSIIAERSEHLNTFISRYAMIAKLPIPSKTQIAWLPFLENLRSSYRFQLVGKVPATPGYCDRAQLTQVMVNLLKNATESGSSSNDITVSINQDKLFTCLEIADRGGGMTTDAMDNALLPFYTTKTTGSGIGLPLCREIIEAHDGKLSLHLRKKGGVRVRILLPLSSEVNTASPPIAPVA